MHSKTAATTPNPENDNGAGSSGEFLEVRAANHANKNKSEDEPEDEMSEEAKLPETSAVSAEKQEEPVSDESTSEAAAVSEEAIRDGDAEKAKLLEDNVRLMDEIKLLRNENQRLGNENQRLQKLQLDDSWLDDWNAQIFRCTDCDRPFGTQTRLVDHRKSWHSAGSRKIEKYAKAGRTSTPDGIDDGIDMEIFEGGDLILKTTNRSVGYVVSSQVLCMTSKVFLKMLGRDSPFKEATDVRRANVLGFQPAVVTVDDDSTALEFILDILHHRHHMLPDDLPFHDIVSIAEICDKYELQLALKPTVDKFLEPHKQNLTGSLYHDWLLVSYVFGYADIFNKISKELILDGCWNGHQLVFPVFILFITRPLSSCTPSSITDKLEQQRRDSIDKIRRQVESIQAEQNASGTCKGSANRKECEALVLGHLIKSIAERRLNEDETWNQSLMSISRQLKGIADLNLPQIYKYGSSPYPVHTKCSWVPELHRIVDEALNAVEGLKLSDFPSSQHTTRPGTPLRRLGEPLSRPGTPLRREFSW